MIRCSFCAETVPATRYCLNCNTNLGAPEVPDRDPSLTGRLSDAAAAADHESVAFRTLRSRHDRYDRPLGGYLREGEQPKQILDVDGATIDGPAGESWRIRPGFRRRGHAVVTDRRVLVVSPADPGDRLYEVEFAEAVAAETRTSWLRDSLVLELADGSSLSLAVAGLSEHELAAARDRMRERIRARDSAASRRAAFVREADAAVADAADAESALRATAELLGEREDDAGLDRLAAEADSVGDLFARLSETLGDGRPSEPGAETAAEPNLRPVDEGDEADAGNGAPRPALRVDASSVRRRVGKTLREGDPREAGKWAIGAGIAGFSVAVSLPFSTAAGLGAIALGGAATGAYASANPDSAAARIDPLEMAVGAKTRERQWKRRGGPGGAAVGSALGAAEHVADRTELREHARWYANADPELILRGAELGARAAESSPHFPNRRAAAVLGGGFGLAYGYSGLADDDESLETLLGSDAAEALSSDDPVGSLTGDETDPFVPADPADRPADEASEERSEEASGGAESEGDDE